MRSHEPCAGSRRAPSGLFAAGVSGALLILVSAAGCGAGADGDPAALSFTSIEVSSPAPAGAGELNLFAATDGRVVLNWFEREGGRMHALRMSSMLPSQIDERGSGIAWDPVRTIVRGDRFFVNWADFPSVHVLPDGTLWAHWLVRSGPDLYDYDVHLSSSRDGGESWSEPVIPHRDGTRSEHGFVSMFPSDEGEIGLVWLDGRDFAAGHRHPEMSLRFTTASGESLGPEVLLDDRVCDCCQTSAALTSRGPVVVYRDRSAEEIRDISAVRLGAQGWSEPRAVHNDGWEIAACPVNGPMIAAEGDRAATAWFTAAQDEPRVLLAFSDDAGESWSEPVRIDDDGEAIGRVAVVIPAEGGAVVSWLARTDDGAAVRLRHVTRLGDRGEVLTVASASAARAGGFPRMVRAGDDLVLAWRDMEGDQGVRVAIVRRNRGGA
jgi:hypothetical protein